MGRPSAAGDVRDWDEEAYRKIILHERELPTKTVFKTAFAPSSSGDQGPEVIVVASSDGFVSPYSVSSCIASVAALPSSRRVLSDNVKEFSSSFMIPSAQPLCMNQGHNGPVYDVKFYGDKEDALLLSCGDDGHVRGWRWSDFLSFGSSTSIEGDSKQALNPVLDLMNLQHRGPWESLSPVPENNAIATNVQESGKDSRIWS